jgi:hypothetical protein
VSSSKRPPTPPPPEGIVVHETLQLGGVRFHHLRGVAVGFDETGEVVQKIDVHDMNKKQQKALRRMLAEALATLERGGARLH